ncbi:cyclic nucleotide-gated cation channel alpha-3 isoform X6 [Anopheles maculipalpis]|uniref:cyclic nucleotide-gated cation channel alpha-3 isoform X6 n=1 Tax=Anopheles maculipalpis TaxID=1496333 RepID=UPI0021596B74|nr:cyclic nucleotide-gated cation channel alpha-3 isoform X6 [Anopheles maculipalpis]
MSTAKRLVLSLRGRKESHGTAGTSSTRLVSANSTSPGHELDEIAVVSVGAESGHVSYGSLSLGHTNGPRYIPDDDGNASFDSTKLSRHHSHSLNGTDAAIMHLAPPPLEAVGSDFNTIQSSADHNRNSVSRQSLMDIVSSKLGMSGPQLGQSISQQGFFSSRDSLAASGTSRPLHSHVSATTSEMDLSRKDRKRERSKLKAGDPPLLGSWSRTGPRESNANAMGPCATRASTNHLAAPCGTGTGSTCNGADRYIFGRRSGCSTSSRKSNGRRWSFVFDPAGRLCYYWSMVVSMAFLYNFWVIIYRFAFQEINGESIVLWFCLDYFSDFLYLVDILFHFRTGYLEDGVLQTDSTKLRQHYMNSTTFYIDCLCLLPLDFLYLSIGFNSILRSFRLVKIYRFWAFMDRTERHTNYPNLFRSTSLIHYLLVIFHWNGCLYHIIYKNNGFGSKNWVYHDSESADVVKQYLQSYYWCTLALTTIGDLPRPRSKAEYVFVIAQLLFGLMLFATVLGHVANIVTSVSAARKEFQAKLDGVKTYMRMRRVPNHLQVKVIKWFDYLWLTQKCSDEERAVSCLPDKLKAEIAINVHLDTLKRVEIFQNTEAGFLCELVLKLRPVLFSPGDFICRKGEVGKEMYIVNRGRLQVVADNGKTVMASLKAGSYFGEISILNMGTAGKALGNRRTASVRSVGYSDLFVLSKKDMWDVLKEYPAARVRLEAIAVKRLEKYKKAPLEKGPPCGSLTHIESSGATPLLGSHEALEGEIKRLRERLHTVESENFTLNAKLAQQQWEVEHRLAEIEMQICGASSASSVSQENETEDLERNRESII